jgi:hypothetical protein
LIEVASANFPEIPFPTLRSDDWIMEETPLVFSAAAGANPAASQRAAANFLRKELQLGDTQRRIQDARLTLERLEPQFLTDQEAWEKEKAKQREKARAATPK